MHEFANDTCLLTVRRGAETAVAGHERVEGQLPTEQAGLYAVPRGLFMHGFAARSSQYGQHSYILETSTQMLVHTQSDTFAFQA